MRAWRFADIPTPLPVQNITAAGAVLIPLSIFSASFALDACATTSALARQRFCITSATGIALVPATNGVIRVEFGWEYREGQIPLKSDAGRRKVPIGAVLRDFLDARIIASGYGGCDRFFGLARGDSTFDPSKLTKRADKAWKDAGLKRITLHECRHTFASLMIAAGSMPRRYRPSWATPIFRSRWIATAT